MVYRPPFWLPTQQEGDLWPEQIWAPPLYRFRVDLSKWSDWTQDPVPYANALVDKYRGDIENFVQAQRLNRDIGNVEITRRFYNLPQITAEYRSEQGREIIDITAFPETKPIIISGTRGNIVILGHEIGPATGGTFSQVNFGVGPNVNNAIGWCDQYGAQSPNQLAGPVEWISNGPYIVYDFFSQGFAITDGTPQFIQWDGSNPPLQEYFLGGPAAWLDQQVLSKFESFVLPYTGAPTVIVDAWTPSGPTKVYDTDYPIIRTKTGEEAIYPLPKQLYSEANFYSYASNKQATIYGGFIYNYDASTDARTQNDYLYFSGGSRIVSPTTYPMKVLAANSKIFIGVSFDDHNIYKSTDGNTWDLITDIAGYSPPFTGIVFGPITLNDTFYIGYLDGADSYIFTWNGVDAWAKYGPMFPTLLGALIYITYGNSLYLLTMQDTSGIIFASTSSDMISWSTPARITTNSSDYVNSMAFGNGKFVLHGDFHDSHGIEGWFATSSDCITWNVVPLVNLPDSDPNTNITIHGNIVFGKSDNSGVFVIVGEGLYTDILNYTNVRGIIWTSSDGEIWAGHFPADLSLWGRGLIGGDQAYAWQWNGVFTDQT